jgi:dynein heavy chain
LAHPGGNCNGCQYLFVYGIKELRKLMLQGILNDLFPGTVVPEQDHGVLQEAVKAVMEQNDFQPEPYMITKVTQLHETMILRHGVMLVGPTGGGKSTVLSV